MGLDLRLHRLAYVIQARQLWKKNILELFAIGKAIS